MKTRLIQMAGSALLAVVAGCATQPSGESAREAAQAPPPSAGAQTSATRSGSTVGGDAARDAKLAKRSVYYDFDRSDIRPDQTATIDENARYLRAHPELKVRIEGNADERGSREYNLALGQRRAENVMKTMSLLGVSPSRVESVSYGNEKPRATGHDEQSWSENRRSDIVYP